jgi:hypothetical protein
MRMRGSTTTEAIATSKTSASGKSTGEYGPTSTPQIKVLISISGVVPRLRLPFLWMVRPGRRSMSYSDYSDSSRHMAGPCSD